MLPKYLVEAEKYVQMNLHPNQIGGVRRGGVILTLLTVNGISPSSVCKEKGYNKLDMPR